MPEPIIFYFDFISPFAHIGAQAIEPVAARLGRKVEWRPVLIGITILKIMGMQPLPQTPLKGPYLARDLQRQAAWFGVEIRPHGLKGVNSVLACRAFQFLADTDPARAQPFGHAVFTRLWQQGGDITPMPAVLTLAAAVGADTGALEAYLLADISKDRLREAVDAAVARGVFGVPSFAAEGELFWGNDHLWMLEHYLRTGGFTPGS